MSKVTTIPKHTVFGEYITLGNKRLDNHGNVVHEVMCTCGKINWLPRFKLVKNTKGCKTCYTKQIFKTHGLSKTPEHQTWLDMKNRCYNLRHKRFKDWGGRGIKVCSSWLDSFENFLKDMGQRPSKKHSIDRVNNDEGYSKENCRWSLIAEQANNKTSNVVLFFSGVSQNIGQWASTLEIHPMVLSSRIKRGWSVEKTLTTPTKHNINKCNNAQ